MAATKGSAKVSVSAVATNCQADASISAFGKEECNMQIAAQNDAFEHGVETPTHANWKWLH